MVRKHLTSRLLTLVPFLLLAFVFLGGAYYVLLATIDGVVQEDAHFAAARWSAYLTAHPDELSRLDAGRGLSAAARAHYAILARAEDIVAFGLVKANGSTEFETSTRRLLREGASSGVKPAPHGSDAAPPPFLVSSDEPLRLAGRAGTKLVLISDQARRQEAFEQEMLRALVAFAFLIACSFGVPAFVFIRERAQKERGEERIEFLAQHDLMTGLMNRPSFNHMLEKQLEQPAEDGFTALHFLDLDRFKSINDLLGHNIGDELIKSVSMRLQAGLGPGDFLARFGGDEFVLAQTGVQEQKEAERRAEAIRKTIGEPFTAGEHQITTTISIGTALAPLHGRTVAELTKAADLALYTAKAEGRDACRLYRPEMDAALQARQKIEKALRAAVADESFELHFQPIVRADEKELLGFEVLLRLQSEDGEDIPPTEFIPVAETMGLISHIGGWVIRKACHAAASWPENLTVSVNMSPRQFENGELYSVVEQALQESGLTPDRLELEITEGLLVSDTEGVMSQLRRLKDLGVSIAMDDFGTGYSSLSYLWRFPFDKLKIDRSFMSVLADGDENVGSILNTIISLGRTLNLQVTAEGVETQEQANFLKKLNCDQLQGYHFGRPMPESDLAAEILKSAMPRPGGAAEARAREPARRRV